MAKKSQINRNKKREKMVAQYAVRRAAPGQEPARCALASTRARQLSAGMIWFP